MRYKVSIEKIDSFRAKHIDFLNQYYEDGLFIVSGPMMPREGGVIIAKCNSKEYLQKVLECDPFAVNNLATYEVIEFVPTKWSQEFEGIVSHKY